MNGDGFADFLVGVNFYSRHRKNAGAAVAFLGSATGLQSAAWWIGMTNRIEGRFGQVVAGGGDANGDGFPEVAVSGRCFMYPSPVLGFVTLFDNLGGSLATNVGWLRHPTRFGDDYGISLAWLGDVNRDG